jgi:hypothetical protein
VLPVGEDTMHISKRMGVSVSALALVASGVTPSVAAGHGSGGGSGGGGGGGGATSAGTISISPTTSRAGSTVNYVLRYQAKGGFSNQIVSFGFPNEFTPPTIGGSGAGNIAVLKGTCSTNNSAPHTLSFNGQWWVQFLNVSCPKGGNFVQIGYNKVVVPEAAGPYTFPGFGANAQPAAPAIETVTPGPVANCTFVQSPSDRPAGVTLSPLPKVSVTDLFGNPLSGGNVALSLLKNPSGTPAAFDGGATSVTSSSGNATFPGMLVDTAGVYNLMADCGGGVTGQSSAFTINPAAPAKLVFLSPISDTAAGSTLDGPSGVQVAVEDTFGNVEINDNATGLSAAIKAPNTPGGVLSGFSSGPTVVSGVATFSDLSIDRQGEYILTASSSSPGLSQDSNTFTINAVVNRPQNGAGNWEGSYGSEQAWLFEYGVAPGGSPYSVPNLQFVTNGGGSAATLGDLTSSGASGWSYSDDTADDRALANPCAGSALCAAILNDPTTADRASGALYSATSFQTVLQFGLPFTGKLTVYALDADTSNTRDQTITVHDAGGTQTVNLTSFDGGAYATFNIRTGAASNVTITATNNGASPNAVISGLFLD